MWKFLRNNFFEYKGFWGFERISQNYVDYNASNVKKQVNSLYTHLQKGMELFCNY